MTGVTPAGEMSVGEDVLADDGAKMAGQRGRSVWWPEKAILAEDEGAGWKMSCGKRTAGPVYGEE